MSGTPRPRTSRATSRPARPVVGRRRRPCSPLLRPSRRALAAGWVLVSPVSRSPLISFLRAQGAPPLPPASTRPSPSSRITAKDENSGALSPDGRQFAFVSGKGGSRDIWVRQVSGGEPLQVTRDAAVETDLVYAPDGETLYYTTLGRSGRRSGGSRPRRNASQDRGRGALSVPRGGRKAARLRARVQRRTSSSWVGRGAIEIGDADGSGARKVHEGGGIGPLSWSRTAAGSPSPRRRSSKRGTSTSWTSRAPGPVR